MTGCRHNAKNTLVKNYLYLAERAGAAVHPDTTAVAVRPLAGRRVVVAGCPGAVPAAIAEMVISAGARAVLVGGPEKARARVSSSRSSIIQPPTARDSFSC